MIAQLPDAAAVTLADEEQIVAARRAYDGITSVEQQALVTNYSRLTDAESIIEYLKLGQSQPIGPEEPETPSAAATFFKNNMVGLIIAGVLLLAVAGLVVWVILLKKNNKKTAE